MFNKYPKVENLNKNSKKLFRVLLHSIKEITKETGKENNDILENLELDIKD